MGPLPESLVDSDDSESERDPADFYDDKVSEILLQAFSNSSIPHEFIADMIKSFEEYLVDVWESRIQQLVTPQQR